MPIASVKIPQIGEGLQEARLVAVLKQPGDRVKRDEPIYQMETDKAVMDVESPYEGVLIAWTGKVDELLAIGAEVATMEVEGEVQEMVVHGTESSASAAPNEPAAAVGRNANIPPRTRAYAKEKGLKEDDLALVPAAGSKLMPSDIDAFLTTAPKASNAAYDDAPMPQRQRLLASRLVRGSQLVVPGTIAVATAWGPIEQARAAVKASGSDFQPSAFTMFAFAVAQVLKDHPLFRSSITGDDTVRTYKHVNLGIAVGLPGDELVIAVVPDADSLSWVEFAGAMRERIELARNGKDQANESVTISLTNMQSFGLRDAVPVVVPPSVGTLFLGEIYNGLQQGTHELILQRTANITLTFDHRLINGVGAANFINAVKTQVESIQDLLK